MAKTKTRILKPYATNDTIDTVGIIIPFPNFWGNVNASNIDEMEERFIHKRDGAFKLGKKKAFDTARAVCKYAKCCYATLKGVEKYRENGQCLLRINLSFSDAGEMDNFLQSWREAVQGSAM